jgi:hypothetical protein
LAESVEHKDGGPGDGGNRAHCLQPEKGGLAVAPGARNHSLIVWVEEPPANTVDVLLEPPVVGHATVGPLECIATLANLP